MGKRVLAVLLLFGFGLQTFANNLLILDYQLNKARYIRNCVNKARPKMHCNGNCQLMKKIRQEQKKDQQNPERKLENKSEVLSSRSSFPVSSLLSITLSTPGGSVYKAGNSTDHSYDIFHPPQGQGFT